jgi:hypothetical protein
MIFLGCYGVGVGIWNKLRLILAYSRSITTNMDQSPFNVGVEYELPEFEAEHILKLAKLYKLSDWNMSHVSQLMELVGGHPYLVANAFDHIASNKQINLDLFLNTSHDGIYKNHLEQYLRDLQTITPDLKVVMKRIVNSSEKVSIDNSDAHLLERMGLVKREGNYVTLRCQLYRSYLQNHL